MEALVTNPSQQSHPTKSCNRDNDPKGQQLVSQQYICLIIMTGVYRVSRNLFVLCSLVTSTTSLSCFYRVFSPGLVVFHLAIITELVGQDIKTAECMVRVLKLMADFYEKNCDVMRGGGGRPSSSAGLITNRRATLNAWNAICPTLMAHPLEKIDHSTCWQHFPSLQATTLEVVEL